MKTLLLLVGGGCVGGGVTEVALQGAIHQMPQLYFLSGLVVVGYGLAAAGFLHR